MIRSVGVDVSKRQTAFSVGDTTGRRAWRDRCATGPERIARAAQGPAGDDASIGIDTGPLTPWLVATTGASGHSLKRSYAGATARCRR